MTIHVVTSDPQPSARNPGWDFVYFDQKSAGGKDCTALLDPCLRNRIRKGFRFNRSQLFYDQQLRQDVLQLSTTEQYLEEPALPPDTEAGWGDDDYLLATASANGHSAPMNHSMPTPGSSPAAVRREHVAARDVALRNNLALDAIAAADEAIALYHYTSRRMGITERPRPMEVQKLVTSIMIQLYKARGIQLSEDDERAMNYA